jgi:DNA-binding transcriptional MerR regulator
VLISELSRRTGVPVATVKFYLREGLLHPGTATARTRADYDETHLARLRLVRALVEVGAMPLHRVREVLAVLEDDTMGVAESLAQIHPQLSPPVADPPAGQRERVAALVADLGWSDDLDGAHARALADGLAQLEAAGLPLGEERLRGYAAAALDIGRAELAGMPTEDRPGAVAYAVIGTLLAEPVILALRRMAHEHLSRSGGEGR